MQIICAIIVPLGQIYSIFPPDSVVLVLSDAPWVRVGSCNNLKLKTKRGGTSPRTKRLHNVSRLEAGMQNTKHT